MEYYLDKKMFAVEKKNRFKNISNGFLKILKKMIDLSFSTQMFYNFQIKRVYEISI